MWKVRNFGSQNVTVVSNLLLVHLFETQPLGCRSVLERDSLDIH